MGKPTGFLEYERREPVYRPKDERLSDFNAVELQVSQQEIYRQAARCMDCGTPFCHVYGCPISNVIPEFNDFVYRGMWRQALEILLSTNNFPEFTGRICPAPCEAACVAGLVVDSVTIRQIELAIIEKGFENGAMQGSPPEVRREARVAVVGAGPAGLSAADTLNRAGFRVVVFDEARHPGGILRYGIPDFKLEKWVVERRIRLMEAQGVVFETGVRVGDDLSYRYLRERFDAICLACGARAPRDLPVPGRELEGIHFAMDYLVQQNKENSGEAVASDRRIPVRDKRVAIIGGGDTGSDCLGTALRRGAKKVTQLEILPKPPRERAEHTPWPQWPHMLRETHAHKEGGALLWSVGTRAFTGQGGRVREVQCAEVAWTPAGEGTSKGPEVKEGTEFSVEAAVVLLAMGFTGPEENRIVEELGIERDARGNIRADASRMTSVPGIFVAGDMALGQSLVVRAIADGRRAAVGIKNYLISRSKA